MAQQCFICSQVINADELAFQHHVNQCLDTPGGASSSSSSNLNNNMHDDHTASDAYLAKALAESIDEESALGLSVSLNQEMTAEFRPSLEEGGACPACELLWGELDVGENEAERTIHVEECFGMKKQLKEEDEGDMHGEGSRSTEGQRASKWGKELIVKASPGLIPIVASLLNRSATEGRTRSAYLCNPAVQHIASQWGDWGWSCGYRNAQMIFSSLLALPQYHCFNKVPTITEFQLFIEDAWKNGIDPVGSRHFNGKVEGKRKWIGTTEVYSALTWLGISATIVDFPRARKQSDAEAHAALVNWVLRYFSEAPPTDVNDNRKRPSASACTGSNKNAFDALMQSGGGGNNVVITKRQPLYLQHQGHSRTIVGVEVNKGGNWLLLFDPSKRPPKAQKDAGLAFITSPTSSTSDDQPHLKKVRSNSSSSSSSASNEKATNALWLSAPSTERTGSSKGSRGGFGKGKLKGFLESGESTAKMLDCYRVSMNSLKKKNDYQLLFVHDRPLLSLEEKNLRQGDPKSTVIRS